MNAGTMLLCLLTAAATAGGASNQPAAPGKLAEKVLAIPAGSVVEIRLVQEKAPLRGRLAEASKSSFRIQYAVKDKILEREVPFDQLKSIKQLGKDSGVGGKIGWGVAGALAVFGALFVILLAVYAS